MPRPPRLGPVSGAAVAAGPDAHLDSRRAWLVAVAAAAANFVTFGTLFSFGVFLTPIAESFGTTTGPVAPLFSGAVFLYYVAGAVGGRLGDRYGVRSVVLASGVLLPLGLALSARAGALWQLYLCYAPLVGAAVGCCYAPLIGAVGGWFERRRSLAIAVVLTGVGGGTLVMPNLTEALESRFGWRTTFTVLAALAAVVIVLAAAVTASPPRAGVPVASLRSGVLRSRRFRRLYLSIVLIGPGFYAPLAFFNDYAIAQGIGSGAAAALIGLVGGSSVAARLVFGSIADRVGDLRQYRLGYLLMLAALVTWLAAGGSYWLLVASAILHGLGWAAWVASTPLVLAQWFGVRDLGGILGVFYTGLGVGALLGPALSGLIIDRAGFGPSIVLVIVTTVAATGVALSSMTEPDRP
jgi:MFS family permease